MIIKFNKPANIIRPAGSSRGLIYLRQSPDWKNLDYNYLNETEKFDRLIGQPAGFTRDFIELWDKTFSVSYFRTRALLKEITLLNFLEAKNCQIIETEPPKNYLFKKIITFSDDDDWLYPGWFKEVKKSFNRRPLVRWINAKFTGAFEIRNDSNNFCYTNSYAIVYPHSGCVFDNFRQQWSAIKAYDRNPAACVFINKILSVTNKHPASVTEIIDAFKNWPGAAGLINLLNQYKIKSRNVKFPEELDWARPYQKQAAEIFNSIKVKMSPKIINNKKINPLLSIIIPCFNDGKYLLEALACLDGIDNISYEVIIINDGSTDPKTLTILNELDKNKYTIINQENNGPSVARNIGIKIAKGEYILPLDADNLIKPDYVYKSLAVLQKDAKIDIVYSDRQEFGLVNRVVSQPDFDIIKMIQRNYIDTCAIFRKNVWEKCRGYDKNMDGLEDWEFWINAYKHGFKFYHLEEMLFFYRKKEFSLNANLIISGKMPEKIKYLYAKYSDLVSHIMQTINNEIEKQSQLITKQNEEINEIKKSLVWRGLKKLDQLADLILGEKTKSRLIYNKTIGWLQNLRRK